MKLLYENQYSLAELPGVVRKLFVLLPEYGSISLVGEMGAGKTTFVRHFVQALDPAAGAHVISPTFSLMNEYLAQGKIIRHLDLYRLCNFSEWEALDLSATSDVEKILTFIEWADRFSKIDEQCTHRLCFSIAGECRHLQLFQV